MANETLAPRRRMSLLSAALILGALFAASAALAQQQQMCAPRKLLLEKFLQEFGEAPVAGGLDGAQNLIEILTSPNGTWTAVISNAQGRTCVVGSGSDWRTYDPPIAGRDS